MPLEVILIDWARDPLQKLYAAYRTCYSPKTPGEVWGEIQDGTISGEKIRDFISERLKTGHASPLEQVVFWFGISGVSRSLSHQFVRHRIGISFEQQSQRYVKFKEDRLEYVRPSGSEVVLAGAVGDPAHGGAHASRGGEAGPRAGRTATAQVRRPAHGLLRRAAR
jgi:thymidylate synthase (FAD)